MTTDRALVWILLAALVGAIMTVPTIFLGDVFAGAVIFGGLATIVIVIISKRRTA